MFSCCVGMSSLGALALALVKGSGERVSGDVVALSGVSRDPSFYCAPLGKATGLAAVLIPHLWTA